MPMVPEAAVAMLACARIGAVHSVIFGGFSPEAVAGRIIDSNSRLVITSDEGVRAGRSIPLKKNVDDALKNPNVTSVEHVVVLKRTGGKIDWQEGRDLWWHDLVEQASDQHQAEEMNAEDPLFILYTSGSTGKPKGVLHTTGGYLVYAALTFKYVFDYHPGDIYWCTADVGWVTGHSYLLYGPLACGATTLMFEGVPNWPTPARMAQVVDKHQVNILYTAPTAIRALMAEGDKAIEAPTVRRCAFSVPWASQLTRKRGSGTGKNRQREMSGGRYLVADRNWRFHDHAAAWRYRAESRFGNTSVLRRATGAGR